MTYRIELTPAARRTLTDLLPEAVAVTCWELIRGPLAENPQRAGKQLRGPLEGRYSARRGQFRVIYQICDERVLVRVIAAEHRRDLAGSLIVVSGLPGVGKTAVATAVAARLGGVHLSVDPVEDAMLRCDLPAGWNVGVAAYEAVRTMAESNLGLGRVVVVDAVNDSEAARDTWRAAARNGKAALTFAVLTCSDVDEHRRRLEGRSRGFSRLPEPSWSQVLDRSGDYAPWNCEHLEVDTFATSVSDVRDRICAYASARHR